MTSFLKTCVICVKERFFLITWISLVLYIFYDTFIYYKHGRQFLFLRQILGLGLYVSRGTAAVLNLCCALILLPLCKKLNYVLSGSLGRVCPGLFFYWLERAKCFHMTVAITLFVFAVTHSVAHFANLWNFSRGFDAARPQVNFATHRNENPIRLLLSQVGLTGVSMLIIVLCMGLTSLRPVRRKLYNAFWYTHQLYLPFMALLIIHPLSGALKEQVLEDSETSQLQNSSLNINVRFVPIRSKTWQWMAVPLICFLLDLLWRICSRNRAKVDIVKVQYLPGHVTSLSLRTPSEDFQCKMGQYVLLQCPEISLLEWHPFTMVKIPMFGGDDFVVWIRIKGDWTQALEKLLIERRPYDTSILVDGPFPSPMESVSRNEIAICVAAGVGITPFVTVLDNLLRYPRNRYPGRLHLLWIVRYEREVTSLADLANKCIQQLRNANRPDRLHIEFYVTSKENITHNNSFTHKVVFNHRGDIKNSLIDTHNEEKETLLTPKCKRNVAVKSYKDKEEDCDIAKMYPILGCRVRRGRPHWDRVFGYWVHLYPGMHLNLYCCGPKKLVKLLRNKCNHTSKTTKTKFTFIHEGFA